MSREPTLDEQEQLARTRDRQRRAISRRERMPNVVLGAGMVGMEVVLWLCAPPGHVGLAGVLALSLMVVAARVKFETPFGFTVATQLAFVPFMFTVSPALVPIGACLAIGLSALPDVVAGRLHPARLLYALRNAWFAFGPAWVFVLVGGGHERYRFLVLLAALAAQGLVDFAVSSLTLAVTHGARLVDQLSDSWVYAVDASLSGVGFVVALQARSTPLALLALLPLLGLLALFARERSGRLENLIELGNTYRGTALLLGDVVAADDSYTGMHSQGVVDLALAVAGVLSLPPEARRNLEFAALLHDVGKLSIPKEIIHKPGKLDPAEWEVVKTHSAEGQRMLQRVGGFMTEVGQIVRAHHERWDGRGYPDGLLAEAAPLEARIITCCDSWNAMRTDRPYRPAMSEREALDELIANAGTQFDPQVAEALLAVISTGEHRRADAAAQPVAVPS